MDEALQIIIDKNGSHNVNDGFIEQLELWSDMGGKIDENFGAYKIFKMKMIQESLMLEEGADQVANIVCSGPE